MIKYTKQLFILAISLNLHASIQFAEVAKKIETHPAVKSFQDQSLALEHKAQIEGSWGDPVVRIGARNYSSTTFKDSGSPMAGLEIGIAQKIALTNRYGKESKSQILQAQSMELGSQFQQEQLLRELWVLLIDQRRIDQELLVLKNSRSWLKKNLKITKKLYANGRSSGPAVYEVEARYGEVQSEISNRQFSLKQNQELIFYITGTKEIIVNTPWRILTSSNSKKIADLKTSQLKLQVDSMDAKLQAKSQARIPDVTFSIAYVKRSDADELGDFVSAGISFPLPLSAKSHSGYSEAIAQRSAANHQLKNYQRYKLTQVENLNLEITKLKNDLNILQSKTLSYAKLARSSSSKSYGLGSLGYEELLRSENFYQKQQLRKIKLESELRLAQLNQKFLQGAKLVL